MENFIDNNYNCCQAIVCAYCEELGLSEDVAFKLTEGFGSGMGGLRDTCGAVTGMFFVISLANSAGDKHLPLKSKFDTYNKFQEVANLFLTYPLITEDNKRTAFIAINYDGTPNLD